MSTESAPHYAPSDVDSLSDSDWLDVASNKGSEDTDSLVGDHDIDRDSERPSSRSSVSFESGERWEGLIDTDDESAADLAPQPDKTATAVAEGTDDSDSGVMAPEREPDTPEDQEVKAALDQSMAGTLSSSRSSNGTTRSLSSSLRRDLRLSFPDPLTSSKDELRSYERVDTPSDAGAEADIDAEGDRTLTDVEREGHLTEIDLEIQQKETEVIHTVAESVEIAAAQLPTAKDFEATAEPSSETTPADAGESATPSVPVAPSEATVAAEQQTYNNPERATDYIQANRRYVFAALAVLLSIVLGYTVVPDSQTTSPTTVTSNHEYNGSLVSALPVSERSLSIISSVKEIVLRSPAALAPSTLPSHARSSASSRKASSPSLSSSASNCGFPAIPTTLSWTDRLKQSTDLILRPMPLAPSVGSNDKATSSQTVRSLRASPKGKGKALPENELSLSLKFAINSISEIFPSSKKSLSEIFSGTSLSIFKEAVYGDYGDCKDLFDALNDLQRAIARGFAFLDSSESLITVAKDYFEQQRQRAEIVIDNWDQLRAQARLFAQMKRGLADRNERARRRAREVRDLMSKRLGVAGEKARERAREIRETIGHRRIGV